MRASGPSSCCWPGPTPCRWARRRSAIRAPRPRARRARRWCARTGSRASRISWAGPWLSPLGSAAARARAPRARARRCGPRRGAALARPSQAVVRRREGRPRAVHRRGADRGRRRCTARGLPRLRRSEAARHPDDGPPAPTGDRAAGRARPVHAVGGANSSPRRRRVSSRAPGAGRDAPHRVAIAVLTATRGRRAGLVVGAGARRCRRPRRRRRAVGGGRRRCAGGGPATVSVVPRGGAAWGPGRSACAGPERRGADVAPGWRPPGGVAVTPRRRPAGPGAVDRRGARDGARACDGRRAARRGSRPARGLGDAEPGRAGPRRAKVSPCPNRQPHPRAAQAALAKAAQAPSPRRDQRAAEKRSRHADRCSAGPTTTRRRQDEGRRGPRVPPGAGKVKARRLMEPSASPRAVGCRALGPSSATPCSKPSGAPDHRRRRPRRGRERDARPRACRPRPRALAVALMDNQARRPGEPEDAYVFVDRARFESTWPPEGSSSGPRCSASSTARRCPTRRRGATSCSRSTSRGRVRCERLDGRRVRPARPADAGRPGAAAAGRGDTEAHVARRSRSPTGGRRRPGLRHTVVVNDDLDQAADGSPV